jgi:hypothetical protein
MSGSDQSLVNQLNLNCLSLQLVRIDAAAVERFWQAIVSHSCGLSQPNSNTKTFPTSNDSTTIGNCKQTKDMIPFIIPFQVQDMIAWSFAPETSKLAWLRP